MKTIFWGNYKGGVGKTTSVFQIAGRFASRGKRVLLIDLDPQCSLSTICCNSNGPKAEEAVEVEQTLNYLITLYTTYIEGSLNFKFKVMTGTNKRPLKKVVKSAVTAVSKDQYEGNLFFIPSSIRFENARLNELAQQMSSNTLNVLVMKLLLDDLEETFDYVFVDCPPTTNILTQSIFLASDYYIVPTIVDEISGKGVQDYIVEIEKTYMKYCMDEQVGGILMHQLFAKPAQFVGVFESIYKERSGKMSKIELMANLDKSISDIACMHSIVSEKKYGMHRYNQEADGVETRHIFRYYIGNKDNRSGGESIPKNTANGDLTPSYEVLADVLMTMVEEVHDGE